jgi:hypothetical protein
VIAMRSGRSRCVICTARAIRPSGVSAPVCRSVSSAILRPSSADGSVAKCNVVRVHWSQRGSMNSAYAAVAAAAAPAAMTIFRIVLLTPASGAIRTPRIRRNDDFRSGRTHARTSPVHCACGLGICGSGVGRRLRSESAASVHVPVFRMRKWTNKRPINELSQCPSPSP